MRATRPYSRAALILVAATVASGAATAAPPSDISALLKQKTQEFSDAGQEGDAAVMERLLDDHVIFFNEGGEGATKKDILSGAAPAPAGATFKLTVTDWNCQVHGNVAVTSFVDVQDQDFHGQHLQAKFRSVETWLMTGDEWRMIGSQTEALQVDPPTVALSDKVLEEYVGTYAAAPDVKFTFTRNGNTLLASTNGSPPAAQSAELKDVFYTPGRPRFRKIFHRDDRGAITGFSVRREGHDILFTRVS